MSNFFKYLFDHLKPNSAQAQKHLFTAFCLIPFILLPVLSINAGISGDEPVHYAHAEKVYNYFATSGRDQSALNTPETFLRYYGQSADDLSYRISRILKSDNPYLVRHLLIAFFGALTILFAALTGNFIAGPFTGILVVIFLLLSPPFVGHSLNNMKDIPFAMGYTMTIYCLLLFIRRLPHIRLLPVAGMVLGTAFSLSVRAGGLLLFPIIAAFITIRGIQKSPKKAYDFKVFWLSIAGVLLAVIVLGWMIGILDWPYARLSPVAHPVRALALMTHYNVSLRQLFDGQLIWSETIPWHYVLKYLLITTPFVILAGVLVATVSWLKKPCQLVGTPRLKPLLLEGEGTPRLKPGVSEETGPKWWESGRLVCWGLIVFCAIFPVMWVIVQRSNLYGGIRHLLFVYPLIVVIAASGWSCLFSRIKNIVWKWMSAGLFFISCMGPVVHIIRNHPVEYVYFNRISGGMKMAWGKYETDYYYHSLGPAVKWIEREILSANPGRQVNLASSFPLEPFFLRSEFKPKLVYVPYYQRGSKAWEYGIFPVAYLSPSQLKNGCWPPEGTIHTIDVEGYPVCAIVRRPSQADHEGILAYKAGLFEDAVLKFREAIEQEPCNETSLLYLGWSYRKFGLYEESQRESERLLSIHPESEPARELNIWNHLDKKEFEAAFTLAEELVRINPKYEPAGKLLSITRDSLAKTK